MSTSSHPRSPPLPSPEAVSRLRAWSDLPAINIFAVADGRKESGLGVNQYEKHSVGPSDAEGKWQRMISQSLSMESRIAPVFSETAFLLTVGALRAGGELAELFTEFLGVDYLHNLVRTRP